MIRHLLKLVWHRKRANSLLIIEIFFSFLVLFGVTTLSAALFLAWRKPLGFDYHGVWVAHVAFPPEPDTTDAEKAKEALALEAMLKAARALPEVESVAIDGFPPYQNYTWISGVTVKGRDVEVNRDAAGDEYAHVMRMPILRGRWFSSEDDSSAIPVCVVDADAARAMFGTIDIAGKTVRSDDKDIRIVGVVAPFRKNGDFAISNVKMFFDRVNLRHRSGFLSGNLVLRVRPGTPAAFEETLVKRLRDASPDYGVRVQHLEQLRDLSNRVWLAPAVIGGIIALFLLTMVALGLSGVLWQTVTRRSRELGLRRAVGATGREVNRQILGEVALLTSIAVAAGAFIAVQLPLIAHSAILSARPVTFGLAAALVTIYALTLLCAMYPSRMAGRVQPAHALHYD